MELDLFGIEVEKIVKERKLKTKKNTGIKKNKKPTISSLNWDLQKEYEKNIRTTHLDNREFESREFDCDIMKDDLRDYIFLCDNGGNRYRERIIDKIKEFGLVKWFEVKGFPTDESSLWYNRYTGTETTLADEVAGYNNALRKENTLEEQGYYLWENYCPKEIYDKCPITETKQIIELKKQRDELRSPQKPNLVKWKKFIINLCKEEGQKIDKIWFNTSEPYDNEIAIRLAGHRCWSACVEFRFREGKLKAYDSHFGGGTSQLDYGINEEQKIKEIMKQVFNKECSNSSWNDDIEGKREIKIDDEGWLI